MHNISPPLTILLLVCLGTMHSLTVEQVSMINELVKAKLWIILLQQKFKKFILFDFLSSYLNYLIEMK